MSITDKLREYANGFKNSHDAWSGIGDDLTAIADRIDAEHERLMQEQPFTIDMVPMTDERMAEHGWVRLPKDADGVPWHINDEFEVDEGIAHVNGVGDNRLFYIDNDGMQWTRADNKRHYHVPTVEDVLREFAIRAIRDSECGMGDLDETCAEYASKLRLSEEVGE